MTTPAARRTRRRTVVPDFGRQAQSACFEVRDGSMVSIPIDSMVLGERPRDPQGLLVRLGNQFVSQNEVLLSTFGVHATVRVRETGTFVDVQAGSTVGALPLKSPTSGQSDYGLIIRPRFDWPGIGPMLADMGFRVVPSVVALPPLPRSDRNIPAWVLSALVLARIERLIRGLRRRFELHSSQLHAPKGRVHWERWARTEIAGGRILSVPCTYPDLQEDRPLLAGIHFTLLRHRDSLEGQRTAGAVVVALLSRCSALLAEVSHVPAASPSPAEFTRWIRGPLPTPAVADGVEAIQWTLDHRGLAGLSDLRGIPWRMEMEEFFEAWVETVASETARIVGGVPRVGRLRQTLSALDWKPAYDGSQRYLVPDVVIHRDDLTIVFDAKYKEHWEEAAASGWRRLDDSIREQHRADLLQALAYSTLFSTPRVVCCLVYPCARSTWESLKARGRLFHRASVSAGARDVSLVLAAVPFGIPAREVAVDFAAISAASA